MTASANDNFIISPTTNHTTTNNNNNTNNIALFFLLFMICLIHSAGYCDGKQSIRERQSETFTSHPPTGSSKTTPAPKSEHKTYPDQNVLVGRIAYLPCHLPGPFASTQEPVQESEEDTLNVALKPNLFPLISSSLSSSSQPLDMIQLILWYHGDDISGSPFYSIDARQQQSNYNQNFYNTNESSVVVPSPISQWKHFLIDPYNERAKFVVNHYHPAYHNEWKREKTNNNQETFSSTITNYQPFVLIIDPVLENDDGLYWCRVDYRWTRTTISKVRLNVYVPPKMLKIYQLEPFRTINFNKQNLDQFRENLNHLLTNGNISKTAIFPMRTIEIKGPLDSNVPVGQWTHQTVMSEANLDELTDALFMCYSIGGNPSPSIQWYWNNRKLESTELLQLKNGSSLKTPTTAMPPLGLLQETFENNSRFHVINLDLAANSIIFSRLMKPTFTKNDSLVSNSSFKYSSQVRILSFLWIKMAERSDHGSVVRCQSNNSPQVPLSKSLNKMFKLDINLNPAKAQIMDVKRDGVTSGSMVHATCLTWGSKPPAKIYWFLYDRPLLDINEIIFEANLTTKSQVRLTLQAIDNGCPLTCLAIRMQPQRIYSPLVIMDPNHRTINDHFQQLSTEKMIIKEILTLENKNMKNKKRNKVVKNNNQKSIGNDQIYHTGDADSRRRGDPTVDDEKPYSDSESHRVSSYFVYDQITLTVEYLPNITIDLLETGYINTTTTSHKDQNRNRKIFVKDRMKLRCWVDANPPPYKIRWLLNHRDIALLFPSNEYHLTDKNRTLLIEGPRLIGLGRQHEGKYQCSAYNQLGRADSNELLVSVLRAPKCAFKSSKKMPTTTIISTQVTKIDSTINYPANLFCQVDATLLSSLSSPLIDDRLWIYWQLPNNHHILTMDHRGKLLKIPVAQLDQFRKLRSSHFSHQNYHLDDSFFDDHDIEPDYRRITLATNGVRSRLTIIPQSSDDFGLYQCWAENTFGSNQYEPCIFNLTSTGQQKESLLGSSSINPKRPPKPLTNCTTSFSSQLLLIKCHHKNNSSHFRDKSNFLKQENLDQNLKFHLVLKELSENHHHYGEDVKESKTSITNQTNPNEPVFLLSNLHTSSVYEAIVYASNDFGISDQVRILVKIDNDSYLSKEMEIETSINHLEMDADDHFNDFDSQDNSMEWSHPEVIFDDDNNVSNDINDDQEDELHKTVVVVAGKPDLHQQHNSIPESSKKNGFSSSKISSSSNDRSATTVSLSTNQNHNYHNNNRFILIIIIVFTIVLITFSILLSIAIGFCLYRRKRAKLLRRNQGRIQEQQQLTRKTLDNEPQSEKKQKNTEIDSIPHLSYESYPLEDYSTGVFILDSGRVSTGAASSNNDPTRPMMIYRDFVSSPPSSSASPSLQPLIGQHLMHSRDQSKSNQQPEFLYQPTPRNFLDLGLDNGNVQLIPSTPTTSKSLLLPSELDISGSSYLSYAEPQNQQSSMFCFDSSTTATETIHQVMQQYDHHHAGLSISEV